MLIYRENGIKSPDVRQIKRVLMRVRVVSVFVLAMGSACLVFDLKRPDRLLLLFLEPTKTYITLGTFSLTALLLCALVVTLQPFRANGHWAHNAASFCKVFGAFCSFIVMSYTGLFLSGMKGVPLWNSWLLPVLFVESSLASGVAVLLACFLPSPKLRKRTRIDEHIAKADGVLALLQSITVASYLLAISGNALGFPSVQSLVFGDWQTAFIGGYVVFGLALPMVLDALLIGGKRNPWISPMVSFLVLAGCYCLRFSIVGAGAHLAVNWLGL